MGMIFCVTGVFSGKLREMDDEKISLCSKGEVLAAVKSERIDPTDDTSLGCAEFCTTVSLISQSWLVSDSNFLQLYTCVGQ